VRTNPKAWRRPAMPAKTRNVPFNRCSSWRDSGMS